MPYSSCVEGVVENMPDGRVGEHSGPGDQVTVTVGKPPGVAGSEPLVVEPGGQVGQGDRSC